jgi:membrane associated rhomboid family serine protease
MSAQPNTFLIETADPETVSRVTAALKSAGIPYETGLQPEGRPWVVVFVPWARLAEARHLVRPWFDDDPEEDEPEEDDAAFRPRLPESAAAFPWGPIQTVFGMVLLHAGVLFWIGGAFPGGARFVPLGAIVPGLTWSEPWRLVTSLFLHSDLRHVFWNGVAMLVFAVPLLMLLGTRRTAALYFASGVGGGAAATLLSAPGTMTIGSSGAVAGLFGGWVALMVHRARRERFGWRGHVRAMGIALLFLPSLLSPTSASGHPISVSSHMGGMLTGMVIGALLSRTMLRRERREREASTGPEAFDPPR